MSESSPALLDLVARPFNRSVKPSDDVLHRKIRVTLFDPVEASTPIDWSMDPYGHPTWRLGFHSLGFLWPSLVAHRQGQGHGEHLAAVADVVRDWCRSNPTDDPPSDFSWNDHATAMRAHLMSVLYLLAPESWLGDAIEEHVEVLKDDAAYNAASNHGIWQDAALFIAGHALGSEEAMAFSERRIAVAAAKKVDAQGVLDEQAPGYQGYVLRQYRWIQAIVEAAGRDGTSALPDLDAMADVLMHMRMPDGRLVPLGDTYLAAGSEDTRDSSVTPAAAAVRIYDAGFVLARSAGSRNANFYAVRFGPGRHVHGHDDHTSLFLYAHGAPRLVEGCHIGYERTSFRRYLQSATAHNVVVDPDAKFDHTATTELVDRRLSINKQSFTLRDRPYDGVQRQREIGVILDGPAARIHDSVVSGTSRTFLQLWHLPPGATAEINGLTVLVTFLDGVRMRLRQRRPVESITVVEGQEDPYLGWVAVGHRKRALAPVIVSRLAGSDVEFVTDITFLRPSALKRWLRPRK